MDADLSARVRAKFPIDDAWGEAWEGCIACWSCGRETRFLSSVRIVVGVHEVRFSLAELGAYEGLFDSICDPLLPFVVDYRIARRPSLSRQRWCLSNGCMHCGAFIGEYENFDDWADRRRVETFPVNMDERWRRTMLEPGDELKWSRARGRRVGSG